MVNPRDFERFASELERIASLEAKLKHLTDIVRKQNDKIDELLALRNKGLGAFWVASSLAGTGLIGSMLAFFNWLKNT